MQLPLQTKHFWACASLFASAQLCARSTNHRRLVEHSISNRKIDNTFAQRINFACIFHAGNIRRQSAGGDTCLPSEKYLRDLQRSLLLGRELRYAAE